jgi:repressor LexA
MVEGLTDRQRQTLQFVAETVAERGYPPSVREICEALGLASSSTVHSHLQALQRKGYVRIDPTKPRAIELLFDPETGLAAEKRPARSVPLLGRIAAGTPILAEEHVEEIYPMPSDLVGDGNVFMLEVKGDSMIDAGINEGDIIICRRCDTAENGDIVVAMIEKEEATLKRLRKKGASIALEAANPNYETRIFGPDQVDIQGRLVGLIRKF